MEVIQRDSEGYPSVVALDQVRDLHIVVGLCKLYYKYSLVPMQAHNSAFLTTIQATFTTTHIAGTKLLLFDCYLAKQLQPPLRPSWAEP